MRIIDANELPEHKFTRESAKGSDYMRGWNDAIDTIIDTAPTVETKKIEHKAYNDGFKDGVDQGIKLSERPQGEWCSVKERLPDKNGRYLVTNYNLVCLRRFSVTRNEFGYFDNTDESYESRWISVPRVTAWMPLPEAYKEAENDNRNT